MNIALKLPLDIFENVFCDLPTVLMGLRILPKRKYKFHRDILERKKIRFSNLATFCRHRTNVLVREELDKFLSPFTLLKQIKICFEANQGYGYDLIQKLTNDSPIKLLLYEKYFNIIFLQLIIRERWDDIIDVCGNMRIFMHAFEVLKTLSNEKKQFVLSHLDPVGNCLFLLMCQGRAVETTTDILKIIGEWKNEKILKMFVKGRKSALSIIEPTILRFTNTLIRWAGGQDISLLLLQDERFANEQEMLDNYLYSYCRRKFFQQNQLNINMNSPYFVRGSSIDHAPHVLNLLHWEDENAQWMNDPKWLRNRKVLKIDFMYAILLSVQAPDVLRKYGHSYLIEILQYSFLDDEFYYYFISKTMMEYMSDLFDFQNDMKPMIQKFLKFFGIHMSKKFMLEIFGVIV